MAFIASSRFGTAIETWLRVLVITQTVLLARRLAIRVASKPSTSSRISSECWPRIGGAERTDEGGSANLEHFPKRLNRGIPLRERIGFKVRAGMEASMDGETVFGRSACARRWSGTGWRYYSGDCGATWSEYQLCRALP